MRTRSIAGSVLLIVGTLFWVAFGVAVWAKRQALDTDNWVKTSDSLLENEPVRTALGTFIVDRLFQSSDVQQRLEGALPPQLDRLAGPAAAGLKEVAGRSAPRLLGSAAALNAWRTANEAAHKHLLAIVDGRLANGEVTLDLHTLFEQVAAGAGLPPGAADKLPPEVATLVVAQPDQLKTAKDMLDLFKKVVWILLALAIAAFAGAVALSRDRRRGAMAVGGCLILAAIALLAVRSLAGKAVVDSLADAPNAHAAADDVWNIATSLLVEAAHGSLLGGLFIVTGAWLAGAGRRATALRRAGAYPLREQPGLVRAGLAAALLLLVVWGPVPWTQRFWTMLAFTVTAFAWLEWIRRRTHAEFPDEAPMHLSWPPPRSAQPTQPKVT
jgi:hypothetical protein